MRPRVLFVHNNFPAQFRALAGELMARGVQCAAIGSPTAPGYPGIRIARCPTGRGSTPDIFALATRAEADLIRGYAALGGARALKAEGFEPDLIIGHPGWGETVLLEDLWPDAKQILYSEYFYRGRGSDIDFDYEFGRPTDDSYLIARAKSAVMSLALSQADAIVAPTAFQASVLPRVFRERTRIIHEGIDVEAIQPGAPEPFALDDGRVIWPGTPVITHVNNKLEPLRGLHIFARALPRLLEQVPEAQVLIAGTETKSAYGGIAPNDLSWKDACLQGLEDRLDLGRVHFLGRTTHDRMLAALKLSTAHVYYTYPFVLSWSVIEAMASGCYVVGSDTPPLHDAVTDGVNGRLLPFFDVEALSSTLIDACRRPEAAAPLRAAARETAVARFSRKAGTAAWIALIEELGFEVPAVQAQPAGAST